VLKIGFLDVDGEPRSGLPYVLEIDGELLEGTTDGDGVLSERIPPDAERGRLTLGTGDDQEVMELRLGHLEPVTEVTGIQARLNGLGYNCGDEDGVMNESTRMALAQFQDDYGLEATSEPDDETLELLEKEHQLS
jgi:N-acetylmuramoyl-L-alanine amidase